MGFSLMDKSDNVHLNDIGARFLGNGLEIDMIITHSCYVHAIGEHSVEKYYEWYCECGAQSKWLYRSYFNAKVGYRTHRRRVHRHGLDIVK